jgi:hypothetical protein
MLTIIKLLCICIYHEPLLNRENLENAFHYLEKDKLLVIHPTHCSFYMNQSIADELFPSFTISEKYHTRFDCLFELVLLGRKSQVDVFIVVQY